MPVDALSVIVHRDKAERRGRGPRRTEGVSMDSHEDAGRRRRRALAVAAADDRRHILAVTAAILALTLAFLALTMFGPGQPATGAPAALATAR